MADDRRSESVLNAGFGGGRLTQRRHTDELGGTGMENYQAANELEGAAATDGNVAYGNTSGNTGYRMGRQNP